MLPLVRPGPLSSVPPPLATPEQGATETRAEATVDALGPAAVDRIVAVLDAAGPPAPEGRLRRYAAELIRCTALQSANSDPLRPRIHWSLFPGARAGLDNPDTRYRFLPVTPEATYEIRGRRGTSTDVSFQLFDTWQGDGVIGEQLGFLPGRSLVVDTDGRFTVTLDARAADGRPNHLQLPPGAAQVTIRDTLADWVLTPMTLDVVRTDGAPAPAPLGPGVVTERTAERLEGQAAFWPGIVAAFLSFAPNGVGRAAATPGGLADQQSAGGRFDLPDDRAMVLRLGSGGAPYVGIQLGSHQFVSVDAWDRPASLNPSQLVPDPDGALTVVVGRRDPGWANWLDPDDHDAGVVFLRWQGLDGPLADDDQPTVTVVPADEVADVVPGPCPVDAAQRSAQRASRRATACRPPTD